MFTCRFPSARSAFCSTWNWVKVERFKNNPQTKIDAMGMNWKKIAKLMWWEIIDWVMLIHSQTFPADSSTWSHALNNKCLPLSEHFRNLSNYEALHKLLTLDSATLRAPAAANSWMDRAANHEWRKQLEAPRMSRSRNKILKKKPFCRSIISGCHGSCKRVNPVHVHKLEALATCFHSPELGRLHYVFNFNVPFAFGSY